MLLNAILSGTSFSLYGNFSLWIQFHPPFGAGIQFLKYRELKSEVMLLAQSEWVYSLTLWGSFRPQKFFKKPYWSFIYGCTLDLQLDHNYTKENGLLGMFVIF